MIRKVCMAIDLEDNENVIAEYENFHKPGNVPVEVLRSIRDDGFLSMEIYRFENRLFMIATMDDSHKTIRREKGDVVNAWDARMSALQMPIKNAKSWREMQLIFDLSEHVEIPEENISPQNS